MKDTIRLLKHVIELDRNNLPNMAFSELYNAARHSAGTGWLFIVEVDGFFVRVLFADPMKSQLHGGCQGSPAYCAEYLLGVFSLEGLHNMKGSEP